MDINDMQPGRFNPRNGQRARLQSAPTATAAATDSVRLQSAPTAAAAATDSVRAYKARLP